jgi:hypothetical protein
VFYTCSDNGSEINRVTNSKVSLSTTTCLLLEHHELETLWSEKGELQWRRQDSLLVPCHGHCRLGRALVLVEREHDSCVILAHKKCTAQGFAWLLFKEHGCERSSEYLSNARSLRVPERLWRMV